MRKWLKIKVFTYRRLSFRISVQGDFVRPGTILAPQRPAIKSQEEKEQKEKEEKAREGRHEKARRDRARRVSRKLRGSPQWHWANAKGPNDWEWKIQLNGKQKRSRWKHQKQKRESRSVNEKNKQQRCRKNDSALCKEQTAPAQREGTAIFSTPSTSL